MTVFPRISIGYQHNKATYKDAFVDHPSQTSIGLIVNDDVSCA